MRGPNRKTKWATILFVGIVAAISFSAAPIVAQDFVKVSLPHKVSIELPKTWVVLSGTQRTALHSFSDEVLDLSGIGKPISDLPFAANYLDERGDVTGILNIRYYPDLELTQVDIRNATDQEIQKFDAALQDGINKSSKAFGFRVSSWGGTKRVNINGITALLSEYRRGSADGAGEFRVRLVRVLAGPQSFTLTVSYRLAASHLLPVTDRIINSLRMGGIS